MKGYQRIWSWAHWTLRNLSWLSRCNIDRCMPHFADS